MHAPSHVRPLRRFALTLLLAAVMSSGCSVASHLPEQLDLGRFGQGVRFTNGTVDLVIVPNLGRIMRYGYVGGPNLLYNISQADMPASGYVNWGGDKAWIWPQSTWLTLTGRKWPPPAAADGLPWSLKVQSERFCRLTSGVIEPWGAIIERDITIAPTGTAVRVTNRLIRITGGTTQPAAVWSVTQVRVPTQLEAHLQPTANVDKPYAQLLPHSFAEIVRNGDRLRLIRNTKDPAKIGLDADALSVVIGATRFTQTLEASSPVSSYRPNEKAQVYTMPDPGPSGSPEAYVEMEFTSPLIDLSATHVSSMAVRWELSSAAAQR